MDKLLNLLNQFCEESGKQYRFKEIVDSDFFVIDEYRGLGYETIFCKKFLFVKWLVETNKIDIERLHKIVDYILVIKGSYVNAHDYNSDCLLMLLSIQENPTEFLVSLLK